MVDLSKVKVPSKWSETRKEIEAAVLDVLGELPKDRAELQVKMIDEVEFPGYTRRRVNYFVDSWERVTAWVFVPEGKEEVPALLCCHQATYFGKDEAAGLEGDPTLAFAQRYAERGYVTIAPDTITAGDRVSNNRGPLDTRNFYKDYPRMSAWGKMLVDHRHAIDALCDMKRVDAARIGVVGHGLGGANALLLTAFDERIQACAASCGFTRFADDGDPGRWAREEGLVLIPALREAIAAKAFPFDWEHILALIAPSPTLLLTAANDDTLSNTRSCAKAAKQAAAVYKLLGASSAIENLVHQEGHGVPLEAMEAADEWFERWL